MRKCLWMQDFRTPVLILKYYSRDSIFKIYKCKLLRLSKFYLGTLNIWSLPAHNSASFDLLFVITVFEFLSAIANYYLLTIKQYSYINYDFNTQLRLKQYFYRH